MTLKATNISTGDYKTTQQNTFRWAILVALLLYFSFLALVQETNVLNDSQQYFMMHIHREPLYCLFLWLFRIVFGGKELYLEFVAIVQGILAAVSIWHLAEVVRKQFALKIWEEFIISLIGVFPFLLTRFFSATHIDISNSIMSEALCLPLFYFYLAALYKMICNKRKSDFLKTLVLALLLSLTRGQMMITILVWAILTFYLQIFVARKNVLKQIVGLVLCICVAFSARSIFVKSYNAVFNDHFIGNTYGQVGLFTNVLYACNPEDVAYVSDDMNKLFFEQMMQLAMENEATHSFAGASLTERAKGIEEHHDFLKFMCIEDVMYQYYDVHVTTDYILQNQMEDAAAKQLIKDLLPHCFGVWLLDYVALVYYGLVRSIALIHPMVNVVAILFLIVTIIVTMYQLIKKPCNEQALCMMASILVVLGNAFACALTIMCLSRYMIYGFCGFYISCYVMGREVWLKRKKGEHLNVQH